MEDKVALYENLDIFHKLNSTIISDNYKNNIDKPISLFGVFDGHCGVDCSHYVSSHLPLYIFQNPEFKSLGELKANEFFDSMNYLLSKSFKGINTRFTEKALQEVF